MMTGPDNTTCKIAVVVPCYRVRRKILELLARISPVVARIYCVDDNCPEKSGVLIEELCRDPRVRVVYNNTNLGVGGAVLRGYREALNEGATVIVKIDGDGQMDPALISNFARPIVAAEADYTKGNRFYRLEDIQAMPGKRFFGNVILSFVSKISSGYWNVFDPTNGYTAISAPVAALLPFEKISRRYFFESDMLYHLGNLRAKVEDIPMTAVYGSETSSLHVARVVFPFLYMHARNFLKRLFYNYFWRDFTIASLQLVVGAILLLFGSAFGLWHWSASVREGVPASAGTVMVATLPIIVGIQFLLSFLQYDMANIPQSCMGSKLENFTFRQRPRIEPNGKGGTAS